MEIKSMEVSELEARKLELRDLVNAEDADLDSIEEEVREINSELEQRAAAEAEKVEERQEVAEATINQIIEEKEETIMERTFAVDSAEYRVAWLKSMAGLQLDAEERTAMATVDVVPTITENTIINRLKNNALLKLIDFTNYKGYVNIPNYTTNGDAAWGTSNEQQDEIGHVSLSLYQLIKTVEVPGVFDANSIDAFESKMIEALTNKIESALQAAVIVGTGAANSQPTGIATTHSTDDGTFTKAGITKADLLGIMGSLPGKYQPDACWIMPNAVFYEAMANVDLPGFVALNAELKPVICGKPVVLDDSCVISSTDTIFYGAAKAYHLNLGSGGIQIAKDLSIGFKSNAVNFRGVCAADGKLDNTDAFVRYTRATA